MQAEGPLSVADYMHECLFHPQWGYYNTRSPIGAAGDFITAPEISQMFGEMIGAWLQDLWQRLDQPRKVNLVELGPGQGTLMQDLLRSIGPNFKKALSVHMLEISPVLQNQQQDRLQSETVVWHPDLEHTLAACQDAPLFIVANEFFDALPVHQMIKQGQDWVEQRIDWCNQENCFRFTQDLSKVTSDAVFETCPMAQDIMQKLSQKIVQLEGAMLVIDYGYQDGSTGATLQAVSKHKYHDPLLHIGKVDLTAHVDFKTLVEVAGTQGAQTWGPTSQGDFLYKLGIRLRAQQLQRKASSRQRAELEQSLHRLICPTQMGTLFKVLAVTAPNTPIPSGFS